MSTQHFTAVQPRGKKQQFAAWEYTRPEIALVKPEKPSRLANAVSSMAYKLNSTTQDVVGRARQLEDQGKDFILMTSVKTHQATKETLALWPNLNALNKTVSEAKAKLKANEETPLTENEILDLVRSATAGNELAAAYAPVGTALKVSVGAAAGGAFVPVAGFSVALGGMLAIGALGAYKIAMGIATSRNTKQTLKLYELDQVRNNPDLRAQMSAIESPNAGPAIEEQASTIEELKREREEQDARIRQLEAENKTKDSEIAQITERGRKQKNKYEAQIRAVKRAQTAGEPIPTSALITHQRAGTPTGVPIQLTTPGGEPPKRAD